MNEAECINMAKAEINATINRVGMKYKLPPHIIELIMSSELADIRGQIAVMNAIQTRKGNFPDSSRLILKVTSTKKAQHTLTAY